MPTYVYQCKSCDDVFEVEQRISEEPLQDCNCGAKGSLKRLIQPVAVMFNGPGFHINDYASNSGSSLPKADSGGCGTDSCACKAQD